MLDGWNSERVAIRRRAAQASNPGGVARGPFATAFLTHAVWRYVVSRAGVEAQLVEDQADVELRINDNSRNRTITIADRVQFMGADCAIVGVSPPDRARGEILLRITHKQGG